MSKIIGRNSIYIWLLSSSFGLFFRPLLVFKVVLLFLTLPCPFYSILLKIFFNVDSMLSSMKSMLNPQEKLMSNGKRFPRWLNSKIHFLWQIGLGDQSADKTYSRNTWIWNGWLWSLVEPRTPGLVWMQEANPLLNGIPRAWRITHSDLKRSLSSTVHRCLSALI